MSRPPESTVLASDRSLPEGDADDVFVLEILRSNPAEPGDQPHWQRFALPRSPGMTLFLALTLLREEQDPSLQFDFVCRAGICGSCAMLINGRPDLACRRTLGQLPSPTRLAPLPGFALIGDLSVDTGRWMRGLSERLESWIHGTAAERDPALIEEPMEPATAEALHELDRCIECGCCVAACGTAQMHEDFLAAVGLVKVARFRLDPRDQRDDAQWFELIGNDDGVFGCTSFLACEDVCPKQLPLATQIAYLRRQMLRRAISS